LIRNLDSWTWTSNFLTFFSSFLFISWIFFCCSFLFLICKTLFRITELVTGHFDISYFYLIFTSFQVTFFLTRCFVFLLFGFWLSSQLKALYLSSDQLKSWELKMKFFSCAGLRTDWLKTVRSKQTQKQKIVKNVKV
jgi:hypothetical protein